MVTALAFLAIVTVAQSANAQEWPSRTVKVVVPYGAGGVTDTMARVTAHQLENTLHQSFVVEDKPGAGGVIGVDYAVHAPQDGYTILFVGSTLFTVLPLMRDVLAHRHFQSLPKLLRTPMQLPPLA